MNSRSNATTVLTKFRQNNELCVLNLKKIIKQILDSKKADLLPLQVLAIDLQEVIRENLGASSVARRTTKEIHDSIQAKIDLIMVRVPSRGVRASSGRNAHGRASPTLQRPLNQLDMTR